MTTPWPKRRARFNHDWLQNRFLPAMDAAMSVLQNKISDPRFLENFPTETLSTWPERSAEARSLIERFEEEMSPRVLFHRPPLSRCDPRTLDWLPDLVHALWLGRYPVQAWISEAVDALRESEKAYDAFRSRTADGLRDDCLDALVRFRNACRDLAVSISRLPGEILVA